MTDPRNQAVVDAYRLDQPPPLPRSGMTPEMERILRAGRTAEKVIGWRELARRIGYSAVTIRSWAVQLGLDWQTRPANAGGRGHKGVADWDVLDPTLRQLWDEGVTASEIGRRIGLTKSAVLGRARRLKLTPRTRGRPKGPPKPQEPKAPRKQSIGPKLRLPGVDGEPPRVRGRTVIKRTLPVRIEPVAPVPIVARPGPVRDCAWPMWSHRARAPRPAVFCGSQSVPGRPYCLGHCQVAYRLVEAA